MINLYTLEAFIVIIAVFVVIILVFVCMDIFSRKAFPVPPKGSAILVTGASTGIGRQTATELVKKGYVVFAGVRKESDVEAWRKAYPENVIPLILDVRIEGHVENALNIVKDTLDRRQIQLTAIINNAGILGSFYPVEFIDMQEAKEIMNVNFFGALRVTQAFLPLIRESHGRIINISSTSAVISPPKMAAYACSKWALEALSDSLRRELEKFQVSVSVIVPGAVRTEIFSKSSAKDSDTLARKIYPDETRADTLNVNADDPLVTSQTILHALTSVYPRTCYPSGKVHGYTVTHIMWLRWLLNDRILDKLVS